MNDETPEQQSEYARLHKEYLAAFAGKGLAYNEIYPGTSAEKKWLLDYTNEKYNKRINLLQIPNDLIIFEYDESDKESDESKRKHCTKEQRLAWIEKVKKKLEKEGIAYNLFDHEGKCPHIHIPLNSDATPEHKKAIAFYYAPRESRDFIDISLLVSKRKLFPVPFAPHWKYGTIKKLVKKSEGGKVNINDPKYKVKIKVQSKRKTKNTLSDKIAKKINITDIASEFGLTKGANGLYICPFHDDKNPSLSLDEGKGLAHCFGCEFSSNIIGFFIKLSGHERKKAIRILMKRAGIEHKKDGTERTMGEFIFDDSLLIKPKVFSQDKLNDNVLAFGFFLPREITMTNDDQIRKTQIMLPVLLCSDGEKLVECNEAMLEEKFKIKYHDIPTRINLRLSLKAIQKYMKGEYPSVEGLELFNKIKGQYEKYLYFRDSEFYDVHAIWDIGTYMFTLFSTFPLLEMRGVKETAKTKAMTVSSFTAFNATDIMINPSESSLFRETNDSRPTKYFDEAERLFFFNKNSGKYEADSRAELINAGYYKKGAVPRQEKEGNKFVTKWYSCYSPTMISSINGLFGATESRAITHITTRVRKGDARGELDPTNDESNPIWQEIRNDLYIFALQNWKKVEKEYREFDVNIEIRSRNLQLWKPLLSIAKVIGEEVYDRLTKFAVEISKQKSDDSLQEGSIDYEILEIIYDFLKINSSNERAVRIYIKSIKDRYDIVTGDLTKRGFNKFISNRLDNLGFKKYRGRDSNRGSYFNISLPVFKEIIEPIFPTLFEETENETVELLRDEAQRSLSV